MNKDYTDITFILDRSGSMTSVKEDTIGGFNQFIKSQQGLNDKCLFTLVQFDHEFETVYKATPIDMVKELCNDTFIPRGNTALIDAIGRTVDETGERLYRMNPKDRPAKVMIVIQTDGFENASHKYNKDTVFDMIKHQREKYNWEFVFLGANQDAIKTSASLGISYGKTMTYNTKETKAMFASIGNMTSTYRMNKGIGGQSVSAPDFTQEDRQIQTGK